MTRRYHTNTPTPIKFCCIRTELLEVCFIWTCLHRLARFLCLCTAPPTHSGGGFPPFCGFGPSAASLLIFGEFGPFWADLLILGEIGPFR